MQKITKVKLFFVAVLFVAMAIGGAAHASAACPSGFSSVPQMHNIGQGFSGSFGGGLQNPLSQGTWGNMPQRLNQFGGGFSPFQNSQNFGSQFSPCGEEPSGVENCGAQDCDEQGQDCNEQGCDDQPCGNQPCNDCR